LKWYECPARTCFIQAYTCRVSRLVKTVFVNVSCQLLRQYSSEVNSVSEAILSWVLTAQLTVGKHREMDLGNAKAEANIHILKTQDHQDT